MEIIVPINELLLPHSHNSPLRKVYINAHCQECAEFLLYIILKFNLISLVSCFLLINLDFESVLEILHMFVF